MSLSASRFINLLQHIRLEHEHDDDKRQELYAALTVPLIEEQDIMIEVQAARDDPWYVPGLKVPAWAEHETRI